MSATSRREVAAVENTKWLREHRRRRSRFLWAIGLVLSSFSVAHTIYTLFF